MAVGDVIQSLSRGSLYREMAAGPARGRRNWPGIVLAADGLHDVLDEVSSADDAGQLAAA